MKPNNTRVANGTLGLLVLSNLFLIAGETPHESYRLEGTCSEQGSDTATKDENSGVEQYHNFEVTDAHAKLSSSIRACTSKETKDFAKLSESAANQRVPLDQEDKSWWEESIVGSVKLSPINCSVLESADKTSLIILHAKLDAQRKKQVSGNDLLSFLRVDKNQVPSVVLQFLSSDSIYDITRHVSVEHICDLNGDQNPEIILKDSRYAGFNYWVLSLSPTDSSISKRFVDGMRGD